MSLAKALKNQFEISMVMDRLEGLLLFAAATTEEGKDDGGYEGYRGWLG
jgi:hypothetical protein